MMNITWPLYKKTKRLIIRPLELQDHENWRQTHSMLRPAKNQWDESAWDDSHLTLKKFKELLKEQKDLARKDQFYQFGIFRREDGVLIGRVSLMDISRKIFQNAYLGYLIYNPFWGQGYASEACTAVLEMAFKDLGLHRVEAGIAPSNRLSLRVARKIGMRREGLSKRRLCVDGVWSDMALYAMTSEEMGVKFKSKKALSVLY